MNGLYPIIRRVRRPLLPPEARADAKAPAGNQQVVPVGAQATAMAAAKPGDSRAGRQVLPNK